MPRGTNDVLTTFTAALAAALLSAGFAAAQELEPRAYSPAPIGTTFVVIGATRSAGGVFADPSLPITDVDATIGVLSLSLGRTFALAGKQVLLFGALPVSWGEASGQVGEGRRGVSRRGLADPRIRFSMILAGSPAMTGAEFRRAPRRTIVGTSLTVVPPLGQYDSTKLVNLGSNRWSFKPEIGVSHPAGHWTVDAYAGAWIFGSNDAFYPGATVRRQDPIVGIQGQRQLHGRPSRVAGCRRHVVHGGAGRRSGGSTRTTSSAIRGSG